MAKKNKMLIDRPMSIEEAYEARPRLWWLYTLIVLIVLESHVTLPIWNMVKGLFA